MRCSSAGWLARLEEECIKLATETAVPTHNHPEGIKGAVVTIERKRKFHAKNTVFLSMLIYIVVLLIVVIAYVILTNLNSTGITYYDDPFAIPGQ